MNPRRRKNPISSVILRFSLKSGKLVCIPSRFCPSLIVYIVHTHALMCFCPPYTKIIASQKTDGHSFFCVCAFFCEFLFSWSMFFLFLCRFTPPCMLKFNGQEKTAFFANENLCKKIGTKVNVIIKNKWKWMKIKRVWKMWFSCPWNIDF